MRELTGRTAVVTGAASGIGRALAAAFCAQGSRVVLADVEEPALAAATAQVRAAGGECIGVVTDVADAASVDALAAAAQEAYGSVHVLCNNAGVSVRKPMLEQTVEDWAWVLGVDLWGVVHGLRSFLPILTAQSEAHVVNTASVAGLVPFALGGPYNAAKAAVVSLSETLHLELAESAPHVGVSVLCPGATRSNFVTSARNRPAGRGTADTGPADTGPADTGPADAGPADAGPADAGPADAGRAGARLDPQDEIRRALIAGGAEPEVVAEQVVQAVRRRTFWVLSHRAEYGPDILSRTQRILDGADPQPVDIGALLARQR